jgi:hypothetical protein
MSLYLGQDKIKSVNVIFVEGDGSTLVEENIKSGITILSVDGTFTSDGTQTTGYKVASSNEIMEGYSAWVDGDEVLGNVKINNFYYGITEPNANLGNDGDIYVRS